MSRWCHVRPRCMISEGNQDMLSSRALCCLPSDRARHRKNSWRKGLTKHKKVDEGGKGAVCRLREREKTDRTWGKERVGTNFENNFCRSEKLRKKVRLTPRGVWKPFDLAWTCRYFKSTRGIEIINDVEFNEANKVFTAQCIQLKKDGQAKVQHKPPILDDDLKKLYESGIFNSDHPKTLLNKVFFEIMLYFCRRGRQNLRQLKKADFEVHTDATGAKFVSNVRDELTKNHREDDKAEEGGVMYATEGVWCPVSSLEKYLQHLNPKKRVVWYDNMVVGERSLGDMMKRISLKEANLSRIYTNHSIRATAVTILDKSGFEARHIMTVSGHRNESSTRAYSKTDQTAKRRMSETLTAAGAGNSQWRLCEVRKPYSWKYQFVSSFNSLTGRARYARFTLSDNSLPSFQKFRFLQL